MSYEDFLNELLPDAPNWAKEIIVEQFLEMENRIVELKGRVEELEAKSVRDNNK